MQVTLDEVAAERARRELERRVQLREKCQASLYEFCRFMVPQFYTDDRPYLRDVCDLMQRCAERRSGKRGAIICLGPRYGKSLTMSLLDAWWIGKHRETSIMRGSYGADLAETLSKQVMTFIQGDRYQQVFPGVRLKLDHQAVADWAVEGAVTTSYFCAGVMGPFTGKGASGIAELDDQVKNEDDALNEAQLEKHWNWYTSVFQTREEEHDGVRCPELFVGTRWSNRDIIGRKLAESDPGDYEYYELPGMTADGRSACEATVSTESVQQMKKEMPDFIFNAVIMQHPIERSGVLYPWTELRKFRMKDMEEQLTNAVCQGYVDTADSGEDSLCGVYARNVGERWYVTDVVFTTDDMTITRPRIVRTTIREKCRRLPIESNNGGRYYASTIRDDLRASGYFCPVVDISHTSNKETRILTMAPAVLEYFVFREDVEPGSDYERFLRELTSYLKQGRNKHDDAADGITGLAENTVRRRGYANLPSKPRGW